MESEHTDSAGRIDPVLLGRRLQSLFAEPNSFPPGQPFVELLTIHKAKGLEWDVVLVPALERSPGITRARLLTWSELDLPGAIADAAPMLLAPIAARGEEIDPLTTWLKAIYREREAAERRRLFYVASTRACQELHLFAAPTLSTRGEISPHWNSLLKAAWPAAHSHFPAILQRAPATDGPPAHNPDTLDRTTNLTTFPIDPEPLILDLAASATSPPGRPARHPILERLPQAFDPSARFTSARTHQLPYGEAFATQATDRATFTRPEGSFAARAFGNVVHTFLEVLATRIAAGTSPDTLCIDLPTWKPRIAAILRADGLPAATIDRLTRETLAALENSLRDPVGLWLLVPHPGAATEHALITWVDDQPTNIRMDRIFHAGPEPHAPGQQHLWIIDYKTASHSSAGLEDFLATQRAAYAPQLETYARILASAHTKPLSELRVALYYPTIPRLIWWAPTPEPATDQ